MTEQNQEEFELDEEQELPESDVDDDSTKEDNIGEDTTPKQKNKSNWKKVTSELKELKKALAQERAEKEELKEWANALYEDENEKPFKKKEEPKQPEFTESPWKILAFFQKNPDAVDYEDEITEAMNKFDCDRDKAWKFVKLDIPQESKTKKDFNISWKSAPIKKDLSKVSAEEALELSKEDQAKWRKLNWWE